MQLWKSQYPNWNPGPGAILEAAVAQFRGAS